MLTVTELENEVNQLMQLRNSLQNDIVRLEKETHSLEQKLLDLTQTSKELEQQKIILNTVSNSLENQAQKLEKSRQKIEKRFEETTHKSLESEQSKLLLAQMVKVESSKRRHVQRKYYIAVILCGVILTSIIAGFTFYEKMRDEQRERILSSALKGKFLVKNLKGESVNTGATWNLADTETLYVSISNPEKILPERINVVKDAILSLESTEIGNSVLYKGWKGALEETSDTMTVFQLPKNIEVSETDVEGDIVIHLTNDFDMDGISGYTNSIVDQDTILHATITVYLANDLTEERLATVVRHEFGHALGLGHSTDPEDLMAPVTATKYPYVSKCDISAMLSLYNKMQTDEFGCIKDGDI